MPTSRWYKTDNVAKVFLATVNNRDTRCMRLSCTLTEEVNPALLQDALLATMRMRPQFQVRIRRGFFWHYLETTDVSPLVSQESGRPCPLLYGNNYSGVLHFKVTYFGKRINLDIFHALSDGTGALEFLSVLVGQYIKLAHPEDEALMSLHLGSGASESDLNQDSFQQFYEKTKLTDALGYFTDEKKSKKKNVYHFRGLHLPMDQLHFMEIMMPTAQILPMAKAAGVSLGSYMGARIMMAMYQTMPSIKHGMPITVSMPVNLRNFYKSDTARNFFNSITISHVFTGDETVDELAKEFDAQLKEAIKPDKIHKQMDKFQKYENLMFVRMVPLALKQIVVKLGSKSQNKNVSFVLSNLGVLKPAPELSSYIESYSAFCSHEELFITALSYGDTFKLGISFSYEDPTPIKNLVRALTASGVEVTINATEVVR